MNTKLIIIATVAVLSLATTAFAQREAGSTQPPAALTASTPLNTIGAPQHY